MTARHPAVDPQISEGHQQSELLRNLPRYLPSLTPQTIGVDPHTDNLLGAKFG